MNCCVKIEPVWNEEDIDPSNLLTVKIEPIAVDETPDVGKFFRCEHCDLGYKNWMSYKNHINVCTKNSKYRNKTQDELVKSIEEIKEETRRSIRILEQSCFKQYEDLQLLLERDKTDEKAEIFDCFECDEQFVGVRRFSKHLFAHTFIIKKLDEMPHMCADCGIDFTSLAEMRTHCSIKRRKRRRCKFSPLKVFPCQICKKLFSRKDNFRDHLEGHFGVKPMYKGYECDGCDRTFGGRGIFEIHQRQHQRACKTFTRVCNECGKAFINGSSLRKHKDAHKDSGSGNPRMKIIDACRREMPSMCSRTMESIKMDPESDLKFHAGGKIRTYERQSKSSKQEKLIKEEIFIKEEPLT